MEGLISEVINNYFWLISCNNSHFLFLSGVCLSFSKLSTYGRISLWSNKSIFLSSEEAVELLKLSWNHSELVFLFPHVTPGGFHWLKWTCSWFRTVWGPFHSAFDSNGLCYKLQVVVICFTWWGPSATCGGRVRWNILFACLGTDLDKLEKYCVDQLMCVFSCQKIKKSYLALLYLYLASLVHKNPWQFSVL